MKFEIKSWINGGVLFSCETESLKLAVELAVKSHANLSYANLHNANLSYANLSYANLSYANLHNANLSYADLRDADLYNADLSYANLSYANLHNANLSYADLRDAKNVNKNRCTPLLVLCDQPGKIRAYKLVTEKGVGPFCGGIFYEKGKTYTVADADCSEAQCAKGISLATLDWCMNEWQPGYRILIAEFTAKDIASIPIATDGKFRVKKCKIVGEKNLKEIGLIT